MICYYTPVVTMTSSDTVDDIALLGFVSKLVRLVGTMDVKHGG